MIKRSMVFLLPLLASACAPSQQSAQQKAAVVVVGFEGPVETSTHALVLGHYDAQKHEIVSGVSPLLDPMRISHLTSIKQAADKWAGGDVVLAFPGANASRRPVATLIPPGTYVVSRFTLQDHWALCLHDASLSFSVGPGQVLLLGSLDSFVYAQELRRRIARDHAETIVSLGMPTDYVSYEAVPALTLSTASQSQDLTQARAVVAADFPAFTSAVSPAVLTPASFNVRGMGFFASKYCGSQ